jgi:DtxR family Mn-dependent transcriptional regulator
MTDADSSQLSASLEDYLEAIYNLTVESKVARSKDIAELLDVSKSSVTGALRVLKRRGLANYKPYDYVTLTEAGQAAATEIARKHSILKSFLVNVLGVDLDVAQQAACKAEHALGQQVIERLLCFIEFVTQQNENGYDMADQFRRFCQSRLHEIAPDQSDQNADSHAIKEEPRPLSSVSQGDTVRLNKVDAGQDLNSRLASMGLIPNVQITVVRNDHPGPFVIRVKGSKMVLGRGMASRIMVS